jgi:hypothetical protein
LCIRATESRDGELRGRRWLEGESEGGLAACDWLGMRGYRANKLTVVHYRERGVRHV